MIMVTGSGGGTGAAIKVISASVLPASAKENTICVISDTPVGAVTVGNAEPASPSAGDVWATVGYASNGSFAVTSKPIVTVYPVICKQYIADTWAEKLCYTYKNGAWLLWEVYLYDAGDEFIDITGGWNIVGTAGSKGTDYINIGTLATSEYANVVTAGLIDLSPFSTLRVTLNGSVSYGTGGTKLQFGVFGQYPTGRSPIFTAKADAASGVVSTLTVDISAIDAEKYIGVYAYKGGGADDAVNNLRILKVEVI